MTSLGRGRGWASAQNKESVLRRPGGTNVPSKDVDVTGLINEINLIDSHRIFQQRIPEIRTQLENFASSDSLKHVVNTLYKQCLEDRKFSWKVNMVFADDDVQRICDSESHTTKYYHLQLLQADYNRRNELQQENLAQFRNTVFHLSGAYYTTRLKKQWMRIVEGPLIDFSKMLLESGALEDIEVLAQHMILNSKLFYYRVPEMEALLRNIRQAIITKELCPTSRALLLYVIDLINHENEVLPEDLQKFYELQLGDKRYVMKNPLFVENEENSEHDVDSLNMLMNASLLDNAAKTDRRKQRNNLVSSNNAVPRAIRGSGGGENKSNHGKPRKNTPAPKQISNNKGVEHDDRFEKDYE